MTETKEKYTEGIGRRKRAVARVRLIPTTPAQSVEKQGFKVNNVNADIALEPLVKLGLLGKFSLSVRISGGGSTGRTEAVRMGLARALIIYDPEFRKQLKTAGFLTRDSREKERRKYGLKKARRAPQFSKR